MRKIFITFICLTFCFGCASTKQSSELGGPARVSSALIEQIVALELEEAYSDHSELYFKYAVYFKDVGTKKVFYGHIDWNPEDENSSIDLSRNLVVPVEFISEERWNDRPVDFKEVVGLSHSTSYEVISKIMRNFAPKEPKTGKVLRSDEEELFVYYDDNGQIEVVDVKNKPADYKIKKSVSQETLSNIIVSSLEKHLPKKGKKSKKVILTLFPGADRSEPFVFVDLKQRLAVSLNIVASDEKQYTGSKFRKSYKTVDNLILRSHVFGLAARPVSSVYRLAAWSKTMASDLVNPQKFANLGSGPVPPVADGEPMDLDEWEEQLSKLTGTKQFKGKINKFLVGGDEFFPRLIDSFLKAKKSIDVRIFIFDNDDYGVRIADILKKRSNEGIKVKVLLDGMGSVMGEESIPDGLPPGYVPPYSMRTYLPKDSKIKVRMRPNAWFKADHIKTIIIDNKVCYTGGMNIGREYRYDWHDFMMHLEGPIVAKILREFDLAWAHAGRAGDLGYAMKKMFGKRPRKYGDGYPIRKLYTWANDPQIFKAQVAAIKNSKKYIYINNAYFSDNTIIRELIRARRRGVDVRVILPVNGNHEIMNKNNMVVANLMFDHGIRVYFYPGMSHIKAAVYDGWLCAGTANFDKLSFKDNLEMNLATSDTETVDRLLNKLFIPDFEKSMEMEEHIQTGLKERIAKFIANQL